MTANREHGPEPAHARLLRMMVIAETAVQRAGLGALLTPMAAAHPLLARNFDALREIGHTTGEEQRNAAAALAGGLDAIIVVLDEAAMAMGEEAVRDGISALAALGVPVVLLVADVDQQASEVADWLVRSVRAVLPLDAPTSELMAAIHAAVAGLTVIEPRVAQVMARGGIRFVGGARRSSLAGQAPPTLTTREREVLGMLAVGHATKTIARELGISAHTVKAHVESIFAKLGATTRAEAVAIGVRRGAVML